MIEIFAANPQQLTQGNACGFRTHRIEGILRIYQGAGFCIGHARGQCRLQNRSFSRKGRPVHFRQAATRQTAGGFIQNWNTRRHGTGKFDVQLPKRRSNASGKSGLDVETQSGRFGVHSDLAR
jgi:hypothetical protein